MKFAGFMEGQGRSVKAKYWLEPAIEPARNHQLSRVQFRQIEQLMNERGEPPHIHVRTYIAETCMLTIDGPNENKVLTIRASGTLTREDYLRLLPELEKLLEEHGSLRFFINLEDFSGFEPGALWEDIKFDYKHKNQYGKSAIVGDSKWEEWGTKFSSLFFDSEMRFFYKDHSDEARDWVNSQ